MTENVGWESIKGEGQALLDKLKTLLHEGNVRRVKVTHDGRTVAEFPLTVGVAGALLAPVVAGIGAMIAMLKDCTIQVERVESDANQAKNERAVG